MSHPAVCLTGRFQPFHRDHLELARHGLTLAERLVVGITNPDPAARVAHPASAHRHLDESNPLDYAQRAALVQAALHAAGVPASRYAILPFPLDEPGAWASLLPPGTPQLVRVFGDWEREKVRRFAASAFPPIVLQGDPVTRLSATDIRRDIRAGEPWQTQLPDGARELLADWLRDPAVRRRFAMPGTAPAHG
jgi:cytidyltransferase-like protein